MPQAPLFAGIPPADTEPASHAMAPPWPSWFTAGKTTPATHKDNVRRGLHPLWIRLHPDETKRCKTCAHAVKRQWAGTYWKCGTLAVQTKGPGTDLRLKWRACQRWTDVVEVVL